MSRCREVQIVLLAWDESSDLPEPIAVHVGQCPACRARFDALFPPVQAQPARQSAPDVAPRRRSLQISVAAIATSGALVAALLWGIPYKSRANVDLAELIPPDCEAEIAPIECPVG